MWIHLNSKYTNVQPFLIVCRSHVAWCIISVTPLDGTSEINEWYDSYDLEQITPYLLSLFRCATLYLSPSARSVSRTTSNVSAHHQHLHTAHSGYDASQQGRWWAGGDTCTCTCTCMAVIHGRLTGNGTLTYISLRPVCPSWSSMWSMTGSVGILYNYSLYKKFIA